MKDIIIELNTEYGFYKVTCNSDMYITDYKDTDSIADYYGCQEMYIPATMTEEDIRSQYRCISADEHLQYEKLRDNYNDNKLNL